MTHEELDAAMMAPTPEDTSALYQAELEHQNNNWDFTVDYVIAGGESTREEMIKERVASHRVSKAAIARKLSPRR